MKKSVVLLVIAVFMNVTVVAANELDPEKSYVQTYRELKTLLNPKTEVGELQNEVLIKVKIFITADNEIVVLQTNSTNTELNNYIKNVLNYKKLFSNELSVEEYYVFSVNFKS